jgi:signal transduction histidine kinase
MAAMVAHEFNNILTLITNYAEQARKDPSLVEKAIYHAGKGGQRATAICNVILSMTRNQDTGPEAVNLLDLVNEIFSILVRDPQKDRIGITVAIDDKDLVVPASRVALQHVLVNLIMNAHAALQTRDAPRRIHISARRNGKQVAIAVRDNGEGIAPDDLDKIFQPFYTTRGSKGSGQGHGLGLAFCQDIISAAGWKIGVQSSLGKGTTFTIQIPA